MSNAVKETAPLKRKRSPEGCTMPVMTHLTPSERAQLEKLAEKGMRSLSATARMLIKQGLQAS